MNNSVMDYLVKNTTHIMRQSGNFKTICNVNKTIGLLAFCCMVLNLNVTKISDTKYKVRINDKISYEIIVEKS